MNKPYSSGVPYSALHSSTIKGKKQSVKTWLTNSLQTFTSPAVYPKVNLTLSLILTVHYLAFTFLHDYNTLYVLSFEAMLCLLLLLDIFANTIIRDADYVVSVPYYYDMALFTYDMVTAILIIMAECWGVRVPISWFRVHYLAQDAKYIVPTVRWLMERYSITGKKSLPTVQTTQMAFSTDP